MSERANERVSNVFPLVPPNPPNPSLGGLGGMSGNDASSERASEWVGGCVNDRLGGCVSE